MSLPAPASNSVPDIAAWLASLGFGPVVTAATANQTWSVGQVVSLKLAANTFTDSLGLAMTYRATLSTGAALPARAQTGPAEAPCVRVTQVKWQAMKGTAPATAAAVAGCPALPP